MKKILFLMIFSRNCAILIEQKKTANMHALGFFSDLEALGGKGQASMIYDKLSSISLYKGVSKNLDTAINFILSHDLNELPMGKTMIEGEHVFVNVMEAKAAPAEEKGFEIHKEYLDIQIDLEGTELIETGDTAAMEIVDYNPATDFGTARCSASASCRMGPGNFIVCMPHEPHKPGIMDTEENSHLKKCVFKVHTLRV